jgi:hypothetical protein
MNRTSELAIEQRWGPNCPQQCWKATAVLKTTTTTPNISTGVLMLEW